MANYTLSEGQSVFITTSTTVDDFIYEGGSIVVAPSVPFIVGGGFLFRPTASITPASTLIGAFVNRLRIECGTNGFLSGFTIYDNYPDRRGLTLPCVVLDEGQSSDISTAFFGGEFMYPVNIICDLAFKKDSLRLSTATDERGDFIVLENDTMAEHMLYLCNSAFESIQFESDVVGVGELQIGGSIQTPQTPNQTLYGFKMDIYVEYQVRE